MKKFTHYLIALALVVVLGFAVLSTVEPVIELRADEPEAKKDDTPSIVYHPPPPTPEEQWAEVVEQLKRIADALQPGAGIGGGRFLWPVGAYISDDATTPAEPVEFLIDPDGYYYPSNWRADNPTTPAEDLEDWRVVGPVHVYTNEDATTLTFTGVQYEADSALGGVYLE